MAATWSTAITVIGPLSDRHVSVTGTRTGADSVKSYTLDTLKSDSESLSEFKTRIQQGLRALADADDARNTAIAGLLQSSEVDITAALDAEEV